jgi:hypothetical protein
MTQLAKVNTLVVAIAERKRKIVSIVSLGESGRNGNGNGKKEFFLISPFCKIYFLKSLFLSKL